MIIFALPNKPFSYTGKGTARRQAIIKEYDPEIEALYQDSEMLAEVTPPSCWDASSTLDFVRSVVQKVLGQIGRAHV